MHPPILLSRALEKMLDLETTIVSRYSGEALVQRLLWVTKLSPPQASQAYQLLETHMKQTNNVHRYKEVFGSSVNTNTNNTSQVVVYDPQWVHGTELTNRTARDVLTSRLQAAQSHLNKEAIRAAYLAISEHHALTGNLTDAFHASHRAKDYCTSHQQTAAVSMQIIELSLHLKNYAQVKEYVTKVEHTLSNEAVAAAIQHKVWTAAGLERLAAGDFVTAALKFGQAAKHTSTATAAWNTVLAPEEVSLYAAFLSLAVQQRDQMVALAEHPDALELVPAARDCLLQFGRRAAYQTCWKILQDEPSLFAALQQDMYMAPHLQQLQQMIRERCVLQYWNAFQRVELSVMASDLMGIVENDETLLTLLVDLIRRGKILPDTRIDLRTRTVVRDNVHATGDALRLQQTESKLRQVTRKVLDDTYSSLVRLACLEHDLTVVDASQGGGKRRAMRGGGTESPYMDVRSFEGGEPAGALLMGDSSDDDDDDEAMVDVDEAMNPEDLY